MILDDTMIIGTMMINLHYDTVHKIYFSTAWHQSSKIWNLQLGMNDPCFYENRYSTWQTLTQPTIDKLIQSCRVWPENSAPYNDYMWYCGQFYAARTPSTLAYSVMMRSHKSAFSMNVVVRKSLENPLKTQWCVPNRKKKIWRLWKMNASVCVITTAFTQIRRINGCMWTRSVLPCFVWVTVTQTPESSAEFRQSNLRPATKKSVRHGEWFLDPL